MTKKKDTKSINIKTNLSFDEMLAKSFFDTPSQIKKTTKTKKQDKEKKK